MIDMIFYMGEQVKKQYNSKKLYLCDVRSRCLDEKMIVQNRILDVLFIIPT